MKALIETINNNRIAQVEPGDSIFPVAEGLVWVDCPIDCSPEWVYEGGVFSPPLPVSPPPAVSVEAQVSSLQQQLKEIAAQLAILQSQV